MDDYITVVEVDDPTSKDNNLQQQLVKRQSSIPEDSSFITVLTINNNNNLSNNNENNKCDESSTPTTRETITIEELELNTIQVESVIVYRLPGERLGFGLKFQGGTRSTEKVQKLFIQSCAKDSPASKVATSWGLLREGDEILSIDDQCVSDMTRIECVRGLKDNVAIKLEVRNGHGQKPQTIEEPELFGVETQQQQQLRLENIAALKNGLSPQQPPPPPPVPPRKLVKRNSIKEQEPITSTENCTLIEIDLNANANASNAASNGAITLIKPFTPPPDAEYYINLFADGQSLKTESESDDTASTRSTVIDKFSLNSNYSSETDLSSFTSLTNGGSDLTKVLKPFTMLEQEFKVVELTATPTPKSANIIPGNNYENVELKTEKINVYENVDLNSVAASAIPTPKPRQVSSNLVTTTSPIVEPKKRSILPMPRKLTTTGSPMKLPIEVAPPKVPENAFKCASNDLVETKTQTNELKTPINEIEQIFKAENLVPTTTNELNVSENIGKTIDGEVKTTTAYNIERNPLMEVKTTIIESTDQPTTINEFKAQTSTTTKNTPITTTTKTTTTTPSKEFITKIPKAIASVFSPNSQRSMERAKTESDIKLQATNKIKNLQQKTALFLEAENKAAALIAKTTNSIAEISNTSSSSKQITTIKSRIPIVQTTPRRISDINTIQHQSISINQHVSPYNNSNIPRMLMQKQKSETDLKLGLYRSKSKESSPLPHLKTPLQRTISAESKLKSPERTLIPVLSGSTISNSSTESLNTSFNSSTNNLNNVKAKGPKPKPPERVQSLTKSPTQIPKLNITTTTNTTTTTTTTMAISSKFPTQQQNQIQHNQQHHYSTTSQIPTMQTFKQTTSSTTSPATSPATSTISPNREIRFKIQTYESKVQVVDNDDNVANPIFIDVNDNESEKLPSLFDLLHSVKQESTNLNLKSIKIKLDDEPMLDRETPPPLVIGKCMKINDEQTQTTYYSSSSSDDDNDDDGVEQSVDDVNKDYDCEDGEKLGPPEVINGPGPSEAYFNLYWHSNMLPTIGEVAEEELSSLEPQSLSNGPIVIYDDLSQQKAVTTTATSTPTIAVNSTKPKKPTFIGIPVLPPTVPNMELERNLQKTDENVKAEIVKHVDKINKNNENDNIDEIKQTVNIDENLLNTINEVVEQTLQAAVEHLEAKKPLQQTEKTMEMIGELNETVVENKNETEIILNNNATTKHDESKTETPLKSETKISAKTETSKKSVTEEVEEEAIVEASPIDVLQNVESKSINTKQIKTTTKKKVIKTTTSTSSTSTTLTVTNGIDNNDDLFKQQLNTELTNDLKEIINDVKTSPKLNKQILVEPTTPTNTAIAFTLQPYKERHADLNTKITVLEERQYESAEQCFTKILSRNSKGEEQLEQMHQTHEESAKLKNFQSMDNEASDEMMKPTNTIKTIKPLTITAATAEIHITELAEQPLDKQSIERGILHLSESGQQVQKNQNGEIIAMLECEHQVKDKIEHLKQDLTEQSKAKDLNKPATLTREINECLTLTKDGEKQVTKRAEITKENLPISVTPATVTVTAQATTSATATATTKKGAKLVKMTEDEKRLEREARELIENYQKVKKEAEKLFQNDENDDGQGFDLNDVQVSAKQQQKQAALLNDINKFLAAERALALQTTAAAAAKSIKLKVESQKIENKPPALPKSAIPDFLMETEPLYVLHKNIIVDKKEKSNSKIEITNKLSTKELNEIQRTPPIPQRRGSMGLAMATATATSVSEKQEKQKTPIVTPAPPIPTKRIVSKSFDSVDHATISMTNNKLNNEIEIPSIAPLKAPIERIIVGVEHQVELPAITAAPVTPTMTTMSVGAAIGTNSILANSSSSKSLHLESFNLPNVNEVNGASNSYANTNMTIETPILMSTSSSIESMKSNNENQQKQQQQPAASAELAQLDNNSSVDNDDDDDNNNNNKNNNNDDDDCDDHDVEDLLMAHDVQGVQGKNKMDENGTSLIMHQATTPIHHHGTAPPPAYSRLPPDGHEFPPNFCEPADLGTILIGGTSVGEPESRIFLEKKQLQYIDASNNTTTTKITKTAAATIATNNQSAGNNKNFNNSNNKSIIMTSLIETTTTNSTNGDTKPPPLPKSVPPPTAVTAATAAAANTTPSPSTRKIYREQLVVNIEAANVEDLKLTNQPRRSSSTLSLSSTPTSASGGSTPIIAQAREQPPDFRTTLRTTRKPSDWHKDEKSERSVRDKIAMFSMDDSGSNNGSITGSSPHLNMMSGGNSSRSGSRKTLNLSSENLLDATSNFRKPPAATLKSVQSTGNTTDYFGLHTTNGDIFATRALSMENLYAAPLSSVSSKQQQQQQMQQQLSKYSESMQSLDTMPSYYASLPRRHGMPQSQAQIERRTSFSGGQMSDEASRKVANLLEHRRRSITKLRGLVIPERPSLLEPILDLPEIKSRDSEQTTMSDYSTDSGVGSSGSATTAPRAAKRLETTPASNSAAYRSIFGTSTQLRTTAHNTQQPPAKPPRTSLAVVANSPMRPPVLLPHDESDSDSVFSSKVSSPPMSPMSANLSSGGGSIGGGAGGGGGGSSTISSSSSCSTATTTSIVPEKFALTRTLSSETNTSIASSTTSTLTSGSGSQASCSSVGSTPTVDLSRRIVKTSHSSGGGNSTTNGGELNAAAVAAAASRKNILASAKCRSGRGESSLLIRQRNQAPYHDDEDSTDGYDEEEVRRVAHKSRSRNNLANAGQQIGTSIAHATNSTSTAATSNSMQTSSPLINYKLISKQLATNAASALNNGTHNNNSLVDRVINVAAYVEVTTTTTASDTDDSSHKSDAANATSPSKISAIFIDEERKASFKAADDAIVVTAKPVKTTTVKTTAAPGVANAKPVKAVIAQQAAAPSSIQATKQMPPPKKSTIMASDAVDASSELQQWMAKSSAKINAAAAKLPEKSLKPVLAKFERSTTATSNTNTSNIGNSSAVLLSKSHAKPTTSTAELRERFERGATSATTTATTPTTKSLHALKSNAGSSSNYLDRFSSLDSVASSSSGVSSSTQNVSSTHEHNEFGSFSSLGSNQSLITAQDIQQIIEEADPPLKHPEAFIVVLQRDTPETTVGITLAGGANYETKEITVNKILADSPAARDGRLRKGDRILAVNGMSMRGLTHNESVSVLKTPRPEVTLVVTRSESLVVESVPTKKRHALGSLTSLLEKPNSDTQLVKKETRQAYHSASRSLDIGLDSVATTNETVENPKSKSNRNNNTIPRSSNTTTETLPNDKTTTTTTTTSTTTTRRISSQYQRGNSGELKKQRDEVANSNTNVSSTAATLAAPQRHVMVCKDNCGLGFSLDGGFDSPLGNRPLLIKKVFYGGAAHRTGQVKPGDEIAAINGLSTAKMTRIEVWNYMNQLPLGDVELVLV